MRSRHARITSVPRPYACLLLLCTASPALQAAQAEAEATFDWLSAFTFAPGSEIDTADGRNSFVSIQIAGNTPITQDDGGLGFTLLQISSAPGPATANAETTSTQGLGAVAVDDGAARADTLVAGILSYTGLFARSFTLTIPYTLRALVSQADGTASAQVFAGYEFIGSTVADDVSALANAAVFGVPDLESGSLTLTLDFDPDNGLTQALLNVSALVEASAAPAPVPLPIPLLLLGTSLFTLTNIRRR